MKACSILLRSGTLLPGTFRLDGKSVYDGWISLESQDAHDIDADIRARGWHFMWLTPISSSVGIGFTSENAIHRAMSSGLNTLEARFNMAELTHLTVRKYPGFHVAHVKLVSRHVQECVSLGLVDEAVFRHFPNEAASRAV